MAEQKQQQQQLIEQKEREHDKVVELLRYIASFMITKFGHEKKLLNDETFMKGNDMIERVLKQVNITFIKPKIINTNRQSNILKWAQKLPCQYDYKEGILILRSMMAIRGRKYRFITNNDSHRFWKNDVWKSKTNLLRKTKENLFNFCDINQKNTEAPKLSMEVFHELYSVSVQFDAMYSSSVKETYPMHWKTHETGNSTQFDKAMVYNWVHVLRKANIDIGFGALVPGLTTALLYFYDCNPLILKNRTKETTQWTLQHLITDLLLSIENNASFTLADKSTIDTYNYDSYRDYVFGSCMDSIMNELNGADDEIGTVFVQIHPFQPSQIVNAERTKKNVIYVFPDNVADNLRSNKRHCTRKNGPHGASFIENTTWDSTMFCQGLITNATTQSRYSAFQTYNNGKWKNHCDKVFKQLSQHLLKGYDIVFPGYEQYHLDENLISIHIVFNKINVDGNNVMTKEHVKWFYKHYREIIYISKKPLCGIPMYGELATNLSSHGSVMNQKLSSTLGTDTHGLVPCLIEYTAPLVSVPASLGFACARVATTKVKDGQIPDCYFWVYDEPTEIEQNPASNKLIKDRYKLINFDIKVTRKPHVILNKKGDAECNWNTIQLNVTTSKINKNQAIKLHITTLDEDSRSKRKLISQILRSKRKCQKIMEEDDEKKIMINEDDEKKTPQTKGTGNNNKNRNAIIDIINEYAANNESVSKIKYGNIVRSLRSQYKGGIIDDDEDDTTLKRKIDQVIMKNHTEIKFKPKKKVILTLNDISKINGEIINGKQIQYSKQTATQTLKLAYTDPSTIYQLNSEGQAKLNSNSWDLIIFECDDNASINQIKQMIENHVNNDEEIMAIEIKNCNNNDNNEQINLFPLRRDYKLHQIIEQLQKNNMNIFIQNGAILLVLTYTTESDNESENNNNFKQYKVPTIYDATQMIYHCPFKHCEWTGFQQSSFVKHNGKTHPIAYGVVSALEDGMIEHLQQSNEHSLPFASALKLIQDLSINIRLNINESDYMQALRILEIECDSKKKKGIAKIWIDSSSKQIHSVQKV